MVWDSTKLTGDTLSADEYNTHVTDQKSRVLKAGDIMTSTLTIDPVTDVIALKIIPENNTGGKIAIQLRNATDGATVFSVDNVGAVVAPTFTGSLTGTASGNLALSGGNLVGNLTLDSGKTVDGVDISEWRNAVSGVAALTTTRELAHHINKAASANVRNSHNVEATTQAAAYTKLKTITLSNGLIGQQRFLFDLKSGDGKATAYGKIYRNGVALGTEQTDVTGAYVAKSEDLTQTWNPGDTAELWAYISDVAQIAYVQNFQIAYDDAPTIVVVSVNT